MARPCLNKLHYKFPGKRGIFINEKLISRRPSLRKSRKWLGYIFIGVASVALNISTVKVYSGQTASLITDNPKEVIDQVWQIVYRDFLDSSGKYDSRTWLEIRSQLLSRKYVDRQESYQAIRKMLSKLDDPYTRFLDPKQFKEMRIDTTGELSGVGIQLSLDRTTNELVVVSPIEGTPASRSGIKPNDVIVSIDGKSTKGMNIGNAVKLIRGKQGTRVKLGIRRNNKIISLSLERARIEIHAVESSIKGIAPEAYIGYIRLKQFNANAAKEMRNAINALERENVLGYVLDLRSNPGGLLEASIDIARQWLNEGIIVSTQTRDGIKDVRRANGRALTTKPVVVLVNSGSASASEILSGAIQENNRGSLVGEKTFGKGLVQSVRALPDGSGLTVTVAKYLTPKGTDIHQNGITPDILSLLKNVDTLKLTSSDISTSKDIQYKVAENTLMKSINNKYRQNTFVPGTSNVKSILE